VVPRGMLTTLALGVLACSTVHVPSESGTVIARTMELGGYSGQDRALPWTVAVHPRGESMGRFMSVSCGGLGVSWTNAFGYVSVDTTAVVPLAGDGMNEVGLTASTQTLRQSEYMQPSAAGETNATDVCFAAFNTWILGNIGSVRELRARIASGLRIIGQAPSGEYIHWSIDDALGEHVVLEVLDGEIRLHNNTVGIMTNDPDFRWHLRNLNNFANLSPSWPAGGKGIQVQTEIGALPGSIGHGFNLLGLPGDYSPPGRFVRLFYLRQYAVLQAPPKTMNDSIALATGLLANVFINQGTVARSDADGPEGFEFTQYSLLKLPEARQLYYKDYWNTRWRLVRLDEIDFSPTAPAWKERLADGTVGVEDVTARFARARV